MAQGAQGGRSRRSRAAGRGARLPGANLPYGVRIAVFSALLLMAVYAVFAHARVQKADFVLLLAPLAIGAGLAVLLILQSRKAQVAQQAAAISEERFRLAVEAARCGVWEWDIEADRVFMSDVAKVILNWKGAGVGSGEVVLASCILAEDRAAVRQAMRAGAADGVIDISFRVTDGEGRVAWVDARGQAYGPRPAGDHRRFIGVIFDVTEERISQARARAAETRLRDAIDSVSEAFVLWDRSDRLLLCNRNYREVFSLDPRLLKPGAPRQAVEQNARLALRQERPAPGRRGVREAELRDGRWIQISERRTVDGGLVMTAADITAIKRQEEARRLNEEALQNAVTGLEASQSQLAELARKYEAEKIRAEGANKAKTEFLANMSHELRTPLNAINGFSEIMHGELFGPLGDARYREYAGDILSSGQHLLAVINDILDMSKIEAGKMNLKFERIDLQEVAEDAARLIRNRAEAAGLSLAVDMPNLPEVEADFRALKQVLLNLLSNAVKFTPRGGQIRLFGRAVGDGVAARRVLVGVQDTGIGISREDLDRLTKPFEQVESQHAKSQQGTGLGLSLTKALVELHGGLLEVKSEPGQGTTVSFMLVVRRPGAGDGVVRAA